MSVRRGVLGAGFLVAGALVAGRLAAGLVVDAAWYTALGVPTLFWDRMVNLALLRGAACLVGALFAWANLHAVRRTIRAVAVPARIGNIEVTAMLPHRRIAWMTVGLAVLLGVLLALPVDDWTSLALLRHGIPFRAPDGILGHDLGYYVYALPLEEAAYLWALAALVLTGTAVLVLYAMTGSVRLKGRRLAVTTYVRRHLSVLGCVLLVLLAWSFRLEMVDLVRQGRGPDGLFSRVDHRIALPADLALIAASLIAAVVCLWAGWTNRLRVCFAVVSGLLVLALGGRHALPAMADHGTWLGDPMARDASYRTAQALYSRQAFDVDGVRWSDRGGRSDTAVSTVPSVDHIALWDAHEVVDALTSRQGDDAREGTATVALGTVQRPDGTLAALAVDHAPRDPAGWQIQQLDLTRDTLNAAPWPLGDARVPSTINVGPGLSGHGVASDASALTAVPLTSWLRRVAHAWALRDPSLLRAPEAGQESARVLNVRNVRDRVERIAPVLVQGEEVVPILGEGGLQWAIQLYSASVTFPFSRAQVVGGGEYKYFRHAATALVEARTGRVRIVPVERPDPIARTWFARIPSLVVPAGTLPTTLRDQLPTNTDGAKVQIATLLTFGSRASGAAPLHVPDGQLQASPTPVHLVEQGSGRVPAWSLPVTDQNGVLAGTITVMGGPRRVTVWSATVGRRWRWMTLTQQMDRALSLGDTTSLDSLAGRTGAHPVRVLPGPAGLRFWKAHVVTGNTGRPFIARVVVMDDSIVRTGRTLTTALTMAGGATGTPAGRVNIAVERPGTDHARLRRWYETMREALSRGDWSRFGRAFDSLGAAVRGPPT